MRTINRELEPMPVVLDPAATLTHAIAYRACSSPNSVKKNVYGHTDVRNALRRLFLEKCSLCEADASKDGVIEHFVPHCPTRAELAYDWMNLHWTCGNCNNRKRKKDYKELRPGTDIVERTLLIDVTCPHSERAEDMIWFDKHLKARPSIKFSTDRIVTLTTEFLNSSQTISDRLTTSNEMGMFIAESGCLEEWRSIISISPVEPCKRPNPVLTNKALQMADRLYYLFLRETNPFSTSMQTSLSDRMGIQTEDIKELGRRYRFLHNLPRPY
ncbi:HNH endonuclease family protein [Zavarzinella formosa]|uniref:hypothetical protein n=1 Tax=Zavarzinella formosa TaxID=360055 RepID=UPI0012F9831E|nr:hypothetical protein [Zavarzinella formosa]